MRALLILALLVGSSRAGIISGGGPSDALSAATAAGTYVQKAGDTMTGRLTAPDATITYGLNVGTISATGSITASSVTVQNGFQVGASTLVVTNSKVGIGTASPGAALHVAGSEILTSTLTVGAAAIVPLGGAAANGIGVVRTGDSSILLQGGTGGAVENAMRSLLLRGQFGTTTNHQASMIQNGSEYITIPAGGGKVGILTITPATVLDVEGNAQFGSGATKSTFTATGFWEPISKTKAQIDALVPTKVGQVIYASDTTLPGLCVSTGTAAAQWRKMESATLGCGTNN